MRLPILAACGTLLLVPPPARAQSATVIVNVLWENRPTRP